MEWNAVVFILYFGYICKWVLKDFCLVTAAETRFFQFWMEKLKKFFELLWICWGFKEFLRKNFDFMSPAYPDNRMASFRLIWSYEMLKYQFITAWPAKSEWEEPDLITNSIFWNINTFFTKKSPTITRKNQKNDFQVVFP